MTAMVFLYDTEVAYICIGAMQSSWSDLETLSRLAHMIRTNQNILEADDRRKREQSKIWQRSFFDPAPIGPYHERQLSDDNVHLRKEFDAILQQFRSQAKHAFKKV